MAGEHQSSPKGEAIFAAAIALACASAAIRLWVQLGWPGTFDVNDRDIVNSLSIMVLALLLGCLWFLVKALRAWLRQRAFGTASLALDTSGFLRMGQPLSGRLLVQRPVAATGPFKLSLTALMFTNSIPRTTVRSIKAFRSGTPPQSIQLRLML